jgi:hypothetical protein
MGLGVTPRPKNGHGRNAFWYDSIEIGGMGQKPARMRVRRETRKSEPQVNAASYGGSRETTVLKWPVTGLGNTALASLIHYYVRPRIDNQGPKCH